MPGHGFHGHHHDHHFTLLDPTYRSPGLAVALSLTPFPVDFGNFYAENLGWGLGYTAVELSLVGGMIWLAGDAMGHEADHDWSGSERNAMVGLVAGYVVVKLVAGIHAGRAARRFNAAHSALAVTFTPTSDGVAAAWFRPW